MAGQLLGPGPLLRAVGYSTDRSAVGSYAPASVTAHHELTQGLGSIVGVCTFDGVPGPANVLLVRDLTSEVVKAVESAADGSYAFDYLTTAETFTVIGVDIVRNYNSVIQARVTPGVPP